MHNVLDEKFCLNYFPKDYLALLSGQKCFLEAHLDMAYCKYKGCLYSNYTLLHLISAWNQFHSFFTSKLALYISRLDNALIT